MSIEGFLPGQVLTAAALVAAFGRNLATAGGTITGGVNVIGAMTGGGLVYGQPGAVDGVSYASIAASLTEPGFNSVPLALTYAPSHDRRSGNGYAALSSAVITTDFVDPSKDYGLRFNAGAVSLQMYVQAKQNAYGFGMVNLQPTANIGPPTGYTNAMLLAAYTSQPLMPFVEVMNPVLGSSANGQRLNVPSSVHNSWALCEGDIQTDNIDDAGLIGGYTINADAATTAGSGGTFSTIYHAFRATGYRATFVNYAFKADTNVLVAFDTREKVNPIAVFAPGYTSVPSWLSGKGAAIPAAAPASRYGGTVAHIDNPSVLSGTSPSAFGTQGGGLGGFVIGSNTSGTAVSQSNPAIVTLSTGQTVHIVAYQADGDWYAGGWVEFAETLSGPEMATGVTLSRVPVGMWFDDGDWLWLEHTGTYGLHYDPTAIGGAGATTVAGNLSTTGQIAPSGGVNTSAASYFNTIAASQITASNGVNITGNYFRPPSYTLSTAPSPNAAPVNAIIWISNGCKAGETTGNGTGVMAGRSGAGTSWALLNTNTSVTT